MNLLVTKIYTTDARKLIPQQPKSTIDDPEEEYLKAIDESYDFDPKECPKTSSNTDSVDICSKIGDIFPDIRNEEDPSVGAITNIQDNLKSSVHPPREDYPPMYMEYSKDLEVSKVVDN